MESLPYESMVAIFAFWIVVVIAFIIFIRRMRIQRANEALHENIVRTQHARSEPLTAQQCNSGRIIQIYYIGNLESDQNPTLINSHNIWKKLLTRIEDHPPSYDEVSSNALTNNNPYNELTVSSASLRQTQPEVLSTLPQHSMNSHPSSEAGVVVVVEQR